MYVDKNQKDLISDTTDKDGKQIKDVHAMDYSEALAITGSTTGLRNTGAYYWLASAHPNRSNGMWFVYYYGDISYNDYDYGNCWGVRPVVSLTSGVYIKTGTGTEADPYILGKD